MSHCQHALAVKGVTVILMSVYHCCIVSYKVTDVGGDCPAASIRVREAARQPVLPAVNVPH